MNKIKLNTNQMVLDNNYENLFPEQGHKKAYEGIRSFSLTERHIEKLNKLRSKYKISKSAILRIILDNIEE